MMEYLFPLVGGGYNNSGLTKGKYTYLHEQMRIKIPKPKTCQFCHKHPPLDMANIDGIYNYDESHWRWSCRSCHVKYDFSSGVRKPKYNEENHFYGKKHTDEAKQKMRGPRPSVTGENNSRYGIPLPETVKQKISETKHGRGIGKDNPFFGKHHSVETRQKMKLAWNIRRRMRGGTS